MARVVAVTGATGYIGRRLCAVLGPQAEVRAIFRRAQPEGGPWEKAFALDVAREAVPAAALDGAEVVFHLAGKAHDRTARRGDITEYQRINVDGTRRVLEAAADAGVVRFVFASSVKATGEGDGLDEPVSPYGVSKREAEELVLHGGYVPEPVVLRLALVYGPGVGGNLGGLIAAIRSHRFPPPPRIENRRSMVHVDDAVRAMILAAESHRAVGRTFVVTDGVSYSTREIYESILRAIGRRVPKWSVPLPVWRVLAWSGDAVAIVLRRRAPFDRDAYQKLFGSSWYDGAELGSTLGFRPRWTLNDALREMISTSL